MSPTIQSLIKLCPRLHCSRPLLFQRIRCVLCRKARAAIVPARKKNFAALQP